MTTLWVVIRRPCGGYSPSDIIVTVLKTTVRSSIIFLALGLCAGWALSAPPSDPKAREIYDHDYKWLAGQQVNFIASNIRGANDKQYPERRQAALDLLKEKHDLTTVPELLDELQRGSFLSGDICDILGDWKAKKALPLLKEVSEDSKRPADVRDKATKAIAAIKSAPPEAAPPVY